MEFVFAGPLFAVPMGDDFSFRGVPVPESIAQHLETANVRRVIGTMEGPNGSVDFNLALLGRRGERRYLTVSRDKMRTLGVDDGETVGVEMRPDPNPDDVPVPAELAKALATDAYAAERFFGMTPGKRRGLVHYVASAKRDDTRQTRAAELVRKLATHTLYGDKQG